MKCVDSIFQRVINGFGNVNVANFSLRQAGDIKEIKKDWSITESGDFELVLKSIVSRRGQGQSFSV